MSIERLHRVKCSGKCERWLDNLGFTCQESRNAALFLTTDSAVNAAIDADWSAYPLLCAECSAKAKEDAVNNKTAGLYIALAKALNNLREAGESPAVFSLGVEGLSAEVQWDADADTWKVNGLDG